MKEAVNPSFFFFDVYWLGVFLGADAFDEIEAQFEHVVWALWIEAILEIITLFLAKSLFRAHLFKIHEWEFILNVFIDHGKETSKIIFVFSNNSFQEKIYIEWDSFQGNVKGFFVIFYSYLCLIKFFLINQSR
jgi:hypothetical protein